MQTLGSSLSLTLLNLSFEKNSGKASISSWDFPGIKNNHKKG
jgi:hypothetical protein